MKLISLFEYKNYKSFFKDWVKNHPSQGRGLYNKVAEVLRTSNAAVSQIFNGDRELNLEQAIEIAEFINLSNSETDYFLLLVEYNRAGSEKLRKKLLSKINSEKNRQKNLINRVPTDTVLPEQVKSIYYSSWIYTGVRNLVATSEKSSLEALSARLNIQTSKLTQVIQFLIENQLLTREKDRLVVGPQKTHLESTSPWVTKHHQNWRLKSIEKMQSQDQSDLFYSAPMSLSLDLAERIRAQLPELIKQIVSEVGESKSEIVRCLNIDWFEY